MSDDATPTKAPAGATDADDVPPSATGSGTTRNNHAQSSMVSAMTPAQQAIWQQQQQQMWQQQQMYLWQQQQFAAAEARKMHPNTQHQQQAAAQGSPEGHSHRAHGQAQHHEGLAWAAAKTAGLLTSPAAVAAAAASGQDGSTGIHTTQYIRRGEEGNDGSGMRGTSKATSGKGPRYVYRDFSHITEDAPSHIVMNALTTTTSTTAGGEDGGAATKSIGEIRHCKLPAKLEHMLSDSSLSSIVGWMPHGRAWKVFKPKEFTEQVLPRYFESSNYNSFIRLVNAWSFRRMVSGPDSNAYYHELFLRGRPHLCSQMKRLPKKARKAPILKDDEPDFYALEERISKGGPVSVAGAGFVQGSTVISVGPTSTSRNMGSASNSPAAGLAIGANGQDGTDNGKGSGAPTPSPQRQQQPSFLPPGMAGPWMTPWMQHNPWMYPQQAPMGMGTQVQAVPMTMYTPAASANAAGAIEGENTIGGTKASI